MLAGPIGGVFSLSGGALPECFGKFVSLFTDLVLDRGSVVLCNCAAASKIGVISVDSVAVSDNCGDHAVILPRESHKDSVLDEGDKLVVVEPVVNQRDDAKWFDYG